VEEETGEVTKSGKLDATSVFAFGVLHVNSVTASWNTSITSLLTSASCAVCKSLKLVVLE
jgi:hypothetical protein